MAQRAATPLLDHIVILIPHSFLSAPPGWFSSLFTFYPGGRHADGLTENTLVFFADGSYIEFIAFVPGIDPDQQRKHRWGAKREGTVIDWALTLPGNAGGGLQGVTKAFKSVQDSVKDTKTSLSYSDLLSGGRQRPDGKELRWAIATAYRDEDGAAIPIEPGLLPFWCLDDTPRELRVPFLQEGVAKHSTGAVGVALVSIPPRDQEEAEKLDKIYDALLGAEASADDSLWDLKTLAGHGIHASGQFRLEAPGEAVTISIALFTDLENLAGQKVGGHVTNDTRLEFELVNAGHFV